MGVLYGWLSVRFARWFDSEDGATAVEYALMIALIALVIVAAVAFLGQQTSAVYDNADLKGALT